MCFLPSPTLALSRKSPAIFLPRVGNCLLMIRQKYIYFKPISMIQAYFLSWLWACFPYLYFDSWEPAVRQNIVVCGKGAQNEANVISYFLMKSEWHPCLFHRASHCCRAGTPFLSMVQCHPSIRSIGSCYSGCLPRS